jgi:hypothetical protein
MRAAGWVELLDEGFASAKRAGASPSERAGLTSIFKATGDSIAVGSGAA